MTRVLVIATARPTFATDVAATRADEARTVLQQLGAEVFGPQDLVLTPADTEAAAEYLAHDHDLVISLCASFSDATPALRLYSQEDRPVLLWSFREPGPVGDRLWLNSLCGANLFGHALVRSGREVRLVYGDPDEPEVKDSLRAALAGRLPAAPPQPSALGPRAESQEASRQALATLHGRRIGLVGEAPPGFTPSEYDASLLDKLFGLSVEQVPVDGFLDQVRSVETDVRDAEIVSARAERPSLDDLPAEHVEKFAAVTSALRSWGTRSELRGMAIRCWPEFPTDLGVCPCSALSRLADEGTPTACERDVYGAVTMLLLEALGAGTTYLVDTVDLDAEQNLVRLWHCGSAAASLAAESGEAHQDVHCNRKIGVAGNFPLKNGPVVMARLTENPDGPGLRLLITAGESVPEPNRFQGNTAAVRLETDAESFIHGLVTGGFPHHTVLAWTDVRPQLRTAADLVGIPVVEW
jgi:L-fucose isomerase-like protein